MGETENYTITIKLTSHLKPCNVRHQIGQEWVWEDKTPNGMCFLAYNAIYPFALVLKNGGNFPWQEDPNVIEQACPDADVVNRFEIRRTPEKKERAGVYDITLKLIGKGNTGDCSAGHNVGDEWKLGYFTPENLCPAAYRVIVNYASVLQYGGQFPWQENPDVITLSCPDPNVLNQFEIRRVPMKA